MSSHDCGLKPLWDQVVLELTPQQEQKRGELYIPESSSDNKPMQGVIVAIGPGKEDADMSVLSLGATVLFKQYSGSEFEREGKKYLVLRASDIMCEVTA